MVWLYALVFIAVCITVNYTFDFEHTVLDRQFGTPVGIFYFILFFAFAYYGMAVPQFVLLKRFEVLRDAGFWIKSLLFIVILGTAIGFYHHYKLDVSTNASERYFLRKLLANSKNFIAMLLPLAVMKFAWDNKSGDGFYGLNFKQFNYKPYITLLLIVLPLIVWASFQPSFQRAYPTFKAWQINEAYSLSRVQMTLIYEWIYGIDFVMIELIFRGALVIGMTKILGRDAILPMVCAYTFLHFGKPLGESLGSFVGGYALGVFAFYSRSIWGGCIVHIGLAWMMEAAALLQHHFNR